jgi:hypothetical protein
MTRRPTTRILNQNTKRSSHYVTDIIVLRQLRPDIEEAAPEVETIKLLTSTGSLIYKYPATATGLAAAIAAAVATNIIYLPICVIAGDYTIPSEVTLLGTSRNGSKIQGTITLGDLSLLETLTVDNNTTGETDPAVGVYGPATGYNDDDPTQEATGYLCDVTVDVGSTAGPSYCVYLTCGGIEATNTELVALEGTPGYAAYVEYGTFYHISGRAVGTESAPYYLDV